jgi:hypothetical protein
VLLRDRRGESGENRDVEGSVNEDGQEWSVVGSLSAPGEPAGSYTPLCWLAA